MAVAADAAACGAAQRAATAPHHVDFRTGVSMFLRDAQPYLGGRMTIVRPFLVLAAGLGTLIFLAEALDLTRLVDDLTSAPKVMMAFVGFCVGVVAILAKLNSRVP